MENQTDNVVVPPANYVLNLVGGSVTINTSEYNFTNQVNYSYFPAGYVRNNTTRLLLLLIPVFIIIALIAFIAIKITLKES